MGYRPIRQAVKSTQAVGGEEIPAPATSPTEIQLAAALGSLDAKCRFRQGNPESAQAESEALALTGESAGLTVCTESLSLPTSTWPKTPSRENSSTVATTQGHWCFDSCSSISALSPPAPKHPSLPTAPLGQLIHINHVALPTLNTQRTSLSTHSKLLLDHDPPPTHTQPARPTTAFTTASITEQYQQTTLLQTKKVYQRYTIAQHGVHFRASARGRPR